MCLAFLLRSIVPGIPTVLLFNRDEDFERNSLPIHCWEKYPNVIGGFDAASGGTWAGITRSGRFGMLTFVREPRLPMTPSKRRGEIVRNFLTGEKSPLEFAAELELEAGSYLGFNAILGDAHECVHFNNRTSMSPSTLGSGTFGVSNADLETPWFKVVRGKKLISQALAGDFSVDTLFTLLEDGVLPADEEVQNTGLPFEREKAKSSLFVRDIDYGTRSSSVVLFHENGTTDFFERSYRFGGVEQLRVHVHCQKG